MAICKICKKKISTWEVYSPVLTLWRSYCEKCFYELLLKDAKAKVLDLETNLARIKLTEK